MLQAAETYALDAEMAAKLRKANPQVHELPDTRSALLMCHCRHSTIIGMCHGQAFNNILKRMLEAKGRGMWNADAETLERLQKLYAQSDAALEGV